MLRDRIACAAVVLAASMLAGCEGGELADVRAKAAASFTCSRDDITVTKLKELTDESTLYEAAGCGWRARFVCESTHEPVAGRDRGGGRGNMRSATVCRAKGD
jgi:hypothetical protein